MSEKNDIRIDVVGNADGFTGATAQAEKELDGLKGSVAEAGNALRGSSAAAGLMEGATIALTGVVATAAAGVAAWATAQLASAMAIKDTADEIDKLSQRMGESTESVSELRYAFELNDASMEEMAGLMKSLANKAQDAARGAGQASAAYKAMGISVTDTNGTMKTSRELLEEVADKIATYKDGAAKAALVQDALGGQWVKMIPLLNQGAQGLRDASAEAHRLGVVFDTELTKQADALNDDLTRLKTAVEGVKISLGRDLIPSLADTAAEMVNLQREGHGVLAILRGIAGIGKIPFDVILGSSKPDLSVDAQLKSMKSELAGLESDLKSPANAGLLGRMIFGTKDDLTQRVTVLRNQISVMEKFRDKLEFKPAAGETKPEAPVPVKDKPAKTGGGGRSEVDQGARMIAQLDQQIALKEADAASTEKQSAAEQQRTRVIFEMDAGTLKVTASQRALIEGRLDDIVSLEAQIKAQREFTAGVERLEAANVKARQSMVEQVAALERSAKTYGLTESAVSSMVASELEEAIAIASTNGARKESIGFLEEELDRRNKLTKAMEDNELARDLAGTKSAKEAAEVAKKARYDAALAKGDITPKQYDELIAGIKGTSDEMGEFAIQAARNMQSAFADFLFDPFDQGLKGMLKSFVDTVRRMAAEAVAAQILKKLFGDMGKTGDVSGWVGMAFKAASAYFGGGAGAAAAGIDWGSYVVPTWHAGGMVTPGGQTSLRRVSAGVFANAPRFHGGGLASDEVPAILQKGERVLTKEQQVNQNRQQQPQNIRIVNAFDTSVVGDFLGSAAGERIILNAVQRNAGAFRQAVAA